MKRFMAVVAMCVAMIVISTQESQAQCYRGGGSSFGVGYNAGGFNRGYGGFNSFNRGFGGFAAPVYGGGFNRGFSGISVGYSSFRPVYGGGFARPVYGGGFGGGFGGYSRGCGGW